MFCDFACRLCGSLFRLYVGVRPNPSVRACGAHLQPVLKH